MLNMFNLIEGKIEAIHLLNKYVVSFTPVQIVDLLTHLCSDVERIKVLEAVAETLDDNS